MFTFNRASQTSEQHSLSVKSLDTNKKSETCAAKYSFYAQSQTQTSGTNGSGAARKISNCTKVENVYIKGKLIGRKYCIPFS